MVDVQVGQEPGSDAPSGDDGEQAQHDGGHSFGLPTATALVMGSIIGTGVFALPSALAAFGPISLVAFVLVTIGAVALALIFGSLSARVPGSGGPYLYARDAFGDFAGFLNAWSYWITAWAGNAAIAVAWVGYVEVFINKDEAKWAAIAIGLFGLWLPAVVNLSGIRNMAGFQIVSTVLKFVPLLFMATFGLLFVSSDNFGDFNVSGQSTAGAISAAAAICLFSFLGLETASVAAGRVRNPKKNVRRATVYGTLASAFVYIFGILAVFGLVSNATLQTTTAPFSDAANAIFGGSWAGNLMAIAAIISGIGCLNGWTMICAEMPYAAAKDGLFPTQFGRTKNGVPVFGILASTLLASAVMIFSYTHFDNVFTTIVLLSVMTAVVPYLFSAAAQLYWLVVPGRDIHWKHLARDIVIAVVGVAFSFWSLAGSGYQAVYYGAFGLFLGVLVYIWLKVGRHEYGESTVVPVAYSPDAGEVVDVRTPAPTSGVATPAPVPTAGVS